jgi:hypothetical protein
VQEPSCTFHIYLRKKNPRSLSSFRKFGKRVAKEWAKLEKDRRQNENNVRVVCISYCNNSCLGPRRPSCVVYHWSKLHMEDTEVAFLHDRSSLLAYCYYIGDYIGGQNSVEEFLTL